MGSDADSCFRKNGLSRVAASLGRFETFSVDLNSCVLWGSRGLGFLLA